MKTINIDNITIVNGDFFALGSPRINADRYSVAMVDPPMNISAANIKVEGRSDIQRDFGEWDHFENYDRFVTQWVYHLSNFMLADSVVFVWCMNWSSIGEHIESFNDCQYELMTVHTWHKTNPAPKFRKTSPVSSCEWLLHFVRGNPTMNWLGQNEMHNFIETPACGGNERLRYSGGSSVSAAQKPESVYKHFLSMYDGAIIDPFAGTMTTAKVVKSYFPNRRCHCVEADKATFTAGMIRVVKEV